MKEFCKKGHPARSGKRWLALLMSLCLIGTMIPVTARAENSSPETGLCEHHTEHTTECGYVAPTEGHECGHVHDEECGYQEASECTHVHTEACGENGESGIHEHDDDCGYAEGHECGHVHDEECGYVEASEGSPCTYICKMCEAQALIDALPDAEDITEENFDEVSDMLGEIDTAKEALTAEESEALDFTKYEAAVAKMMELMGQSGAEEAAVMSVSGFDFSLTGKPAGTVKTINLNAAALRPDSTWSTGGNLVYFGSYNSNPVAYRVLSSPNTQNTQESSENYLLLDCNTILKTMAFSSDITNIWTGSNCTVRNWLNGTEFYAGSVFSGIEKDAIAETALAEQSVYSAGDYGFSYKDYSATNRVFCLSAAEADGLYADNNARIKTGGDDRWGVRSADSPYGDYAGIVNFDGKISHYNVARFSVGVSPALNVNLSSVLFASVSGQSASGEALDKSSALAPVSDSSATEWKLTLLDSSKTVNVTGGQNVDRRDAGGSTTITVPYTYADSNTANPVSQISVMITDKAYTTSDAQVLYYGALQGVTISETTGTGTFTLPADLADKTCGTDYYAYIIAEDVNGEKETDYASAPVQITIPASASKYTVTVTNGTLSGGSATGDYAQGETVTITAGAAPSGQQFKEWEVVSGSITLASSTSETTTFTMPTEAVSVKANYEAIPVTEYTITASAGANGSITPSGAVKVVAGGSQTFTISPSSGYEIDTLKVDSSEVPVTTSYTFSNVNADHTIEVTFKQGSQTPNVPGVTAPSITTQPGNATVKEGETATFTIAARGDNLTYQWMINRNDGNGWVNIVGANAASYTISTVDKSCNGFRYKCVVSNSAGNVESNTATLTVQDAGGSDNPGSGGGSDNPGDSGSDNPDTPSNPDTPNNTYQIIDGANSSWTAGSSEGLTIRGNGEFSKFTGVKVDGKLLDQSNYTAKEGSTIITLKASYLNTLSAGTHTVEILWTDGSASTTFTINANTSDKKDDVPKTGDSTPIAWLFILVVLSGTGLILTGKKGKKNLETLRK